MIRYADAMIDAGARPVFVAITPCRLFDTRPASNVGPRTAPLTAGDTFIVPVRGSSGDCNIPAGAVGVVMNVTIANPSAKSFLTVYPGDVVDRPTTSNLNWTATSSPTPNQVTVLLGAALGDIKFYNNSGSVNLLADIVGYYEDHNHDDAYYTKAQVDARLAAKPVAGFGQRSEVALYPPGTIEVANLAGAGGSGALEVTVPSRLVVTGAVTIGNQASTGAFSVMSCQLQIDGGSGFAAIGLPQGSESIGNSNHDEAYNLALTAAVDRPAGTYDTRIVCTDTFGTATSRPISRNASLTVTALPI